jgi:hypothetical protein
MQFSFSPLGHLLLAYNSARIYVLDVTGPQLDVKRELKILRRPVSTCILDDGTSLAVLSTDMQVDVYDLRKSPPKRTQSLVLDHTPRAIALSPCGGVLAAAYEGGIEVSSLNPGALPTERRSVKCDGVDLLAFSFDGTQLLGTTTASQLPNTVIITAPYFDPGSNAENDISALWTTSILFPNTSRDCSHAVLIQASSSEEASWTFTYDRSFETFRAVRIDDLRNGTTYFTGPTPNSSNPSTLLPSTLPSASHCGQLVSAGFEGKDVWIYGIPEDLEAVPNNTAASSDSAVQSPTRANSGRSAQAHVHGGRVPQWQVLCDKCRNTMVSGRKVTELSGVSAVKWVAGHGQTIQERLVVAARGVLPPKPVTEEDGIDFVDGGRITILDFDYTVRDGDETHITIEVGTKEPEVLEEEQRDLATEVAMVRRRTVAQRKGAGPGVTRAATSAARAEALLRPPVPILAPVPDDDDDDDDPLVPRRIGVPEAQRRLSVQVEEDHEEATLEEIQEALEAPYAHSSPRTGPTLRRAATAAAVNRRIHPSTATGGRIEYRRADGRAEHPHESDADNWVPPPPPYSKDDPGDMPSFLRHKPIEAGSIAVKQQPGALPSVPQNPSTPEPPAQAQHSPHTPPASTASFPSRLPNLHTSPPREDQPQQGPPLSTSNAQSPASNSSSHVRDVQRPTSSQVQSLNGVSSRGNSMDEDIYDVSPQGTPPPRVDLPSSQKGVRAEARNEREYEEALTTSAAESSGTGSASAHISSPTTAANPGSPSASPNA